MGLTGLTGDRQCGQLRVASSDGPSKTISHFCQQTGLASKNQSKTQTLYLQAERYCLD